jgi:hypothetical protein
MSEFRRTLRRYAAPGRAALRPALVAAALFTLIPSAAWASPVPQPVTPPDSAWARHERLGPVVQVENDNWLDVHVYVVRDGEPYSLGFVTGPGHAQFTLPWMATVPGGQVQILVLPIGGTEDYLSDPLIVNPGDVLNLNVQNVLQLSSVTVAPGGK